RHRYGALFVASDRLEDVDDVHRITGAQFGAAVGEAELAQVFAAIGFERDIAHGGHAAENLIECVLMYRLDEDLVVNAAEEGFIGQIVGVEVCGEDHHHFERDLELHAVLQRQVIDAAVEGHDPAVEQVARGDKLAAEVVDEEDTVVGLHLERRGVDTGGFIEAQFEHTGYQLTADHDVGPFAKNPSRIDVDV